LIALGDQVDTPDNMRKLTEVLSMEKPADIRQGARLAPQRIDRILYQIASNIETAQV
jgi:hypothetical protein